MDWIFAIIGSLLCAESMGLLVITNQEHWISCCSPAKVWLLLWFFSPNYHTGQTLQNTYFRVNHGDTWVHSIITRYRWVQSNTWRVKSQPLYFLLLFAIILSILRVRDASVSHIVSNFRWGAYDQIPFCYQFSSFTQGWDSHRIVLGYLTSLGDWR